MSVERFSGNTNLPATALGIRDVTVILPIAGKATRAREVTRDEIPKHLILLGNGRPILDIICGHLQESGFRKFAFGVSFLKERLIDHITAGTWITYPDTTYDISEEDEPRGTDYTILHAIGTLGLKGQAMLIPGDLMVPWESLAPMNRHHRQRGADVTLGLTSHVTDRTTDVGKMIVEAETDRLLWCYGRTEVPPEPLAGSRNLTSGAVTVVSIERYTEMCDAYAAAFPNGAADLSVRDNVLSWALRGSDFSIHGYDMSGEVLDLGTPANIYHGQANWARYDYIA